MTFNRYQASAAHLLGSAVVALCAALLVFQVWYPAPLAGASGVVGIFLLVLVVDACLGPLITLIIFNPAKKELKRDLLVVLLLQVAALAYGLNAVFVARPVYAAFAADRFDLIYANDLSDEKLSKASLPQFKSPPRLGPEIIGTRRPEDPKVRQAIMFDVLAGGDDVPQMPQYYVPYAEAQAQAAKRTQSIDVLRELNKDRTSEIDALSRRFAGQEGGIGFLPLRAKRKDLAVIVGRRNAEVLEIVDLKPWP